MSKDSLLAIKSLTCTFSYCITSCWLAIWQRVHYRWNICS